MDTYGVVRYRAVATSAVREASNARRLPRPRAPAHRASTSRSSTAPRRTASPTWRCASGSRDHPPCVAGTRCSSRSAAAARTSPSCARASPSTPAPTRWARSACARAWPPGRAATSRASRLLRAAHPQRRGRHPPRDAAARGHTLHRPGRRRALRRRRASGGRRAPRTRVCRSSSEPFIAFCDQLAGYDVEQLVEQFRLPPVGGGDAGARPPRLPRAAARDRRPSEVTVPDASLRAACSSTSPRRGARQGIEDFRAQVLASAGRAGREVPLRRRRTPRTWRELAVRLFDELRAEHGLSDRHRLLLEVAALLHDIGNYVNLRGHHKHTQYLLSVSEIFGLSQDDMAVVANVARYHRRACPQKSHLPYMALDRETRVRGQQARRHPAPGQRPRRRPPAEGEGRAPASARRTTGCWRSKGRAT